MDLSWKIIGAFLVLLALYVYHLDWFYYLIAMLAVSGFFYKTQKTKNKFFQPFCCCIAGIGYGFVSISSYVLLYSTLVVTKAKVKQVM